MRLGKTSIYGVFAVLHVAKMNHNNPVQGRHIAEVYGIPEEYLLKILQALARGGVLKSARGRRGGFILNRAADNITMKEIIEILESSQDVSRILDQSIPGHHNVKNFLIDFYRDVHRLVQDSFHKVSIKQLMDLDLSNPVMSSCRIL